MEINQTESSCPYQRDDICAASLWDLRTDDNIKTQYCNSDNHDDCSLFLAKCLRCVAAIMKVRRYISHMFRGYLRSIPSAIMINMMLFGGRKARQGIRVHKKGSGQCI